jgi:predicted metal-dependent phosphoesterase TrpH
MLIDLHAHTRTWSWDSTLTPDDLIERCKAAGLDGVCFSEHDYFWDADAVHALAKKHAFVVIPAVEINTETGHVLCYGIDKYVYGMHRMWELAEHVQRAGGAMVAAHPYRRQMPWNPERESEYAEALEKASRNPSYAACAAIETVNGRGSEAENTFSERLREMLSLPAAAGSDSHDPKDIGRCATEFLRPVAGLDDLIEELKAGRFRAVRLSGAG